MKAHQFEPKLHLKDHSFLIIQGTQPCLIEQSKESLNQYLQGYIKKSHSLKTADDLENLSTDLINQSLFIENKWIIIHYGGEKLTTKAEDILMSLPMKSKKHFIVSLILCHPDKPAPKSKWFKTLYQQSLSIDCNVLYGRDLASWQDSLIIKNQIQLNYDQKQTLFKNQDYSMNDWARITTHLGLAYPQQPISHEHFSQFLHNFSQAPTFTMINQALLGNFDPLKHPVSKLPQEECHKLYWQLAKTIRTCRQLKELSQKISLSDALKQLKIHPWQQKYLTPSIHRYSLIQWYRIQLHISQGDGLIKGQTRGNLHNLIEQSLLYITGVLSCPSEF